MLILYNLLLPFLLAGFRFAGLFNPKIKRGLSGRIGLIGQIKAHYDSATISGLRILIHVASYGELEQAKPIISGIKQHYPNAHIHLTFFSPSGYDNVIGKFKDAGIISYLPLDSRSEVSAFLDIAKPDLVLFTRYDVWPNFAAELARRDTPTLLFAATATANSRRMMPLVQSLHKQTYSRLTKILTISEEDRAAFIGLGVNSDHVSIGGDTRFDQVAARKALVENADHLLPEAIRQSIEEKGTLVFVVGSAWPEDEGIIRSSLEQSIERGDNILSIIVPHEPTDSHVRSLLATYPEKAIRFSEIVRYDGEPVIVVDSIGKLFGLYRYADIAMIGGGFSAGVHNVLEAAVWGVSVIVGPNHKKSQEVQRMIDGLAAFQVTTAREFDFTFWQLVQSEDLRETTGEKGRGFVETHRGATERIMEEVAKLLPS